MPDKVTSLKIDSETWRKAKLLAVKRDVSLKSMIERLLLSEVKADEMVGEGVSRSDGLSHILESRRREGKMPFTIKSERRAVELVREHRGD